MYAEQQQAQRHCPPWPGDYSEAVPRDGTGEGPGAMCVLLAGQLRCVLQSHPQASSALYSSMVILGIR